ncbi:uncharacterized protein LOC142351065 [Convolutriloba macropyga]|uniref:uncharacterized protein LOC142351065 n=1 Tax=Convolutriloba macropyga TaxID=536237 RepID=UPI003F525F92
MLLDLYIACMCVAVVHTVAQFLPSPQPHLYHRADPVCTAIYQEDHSTSAEIEYPLLNQTIPTAWEPSGDKVGYTEHNRFAQVILCNLNKKRQDAFIPPLQWHYGLSYKARTHNKCTSPIWGNYHYGFELEKLTANKLSSTYYEGDGWDYVEEWYGRLKYYQYPVNNATLQPDYFDDCPRRPYNREIKSSKPFTIMMWQWAFFVGCAPVTCTSVSKLNCYFTSYLGYPIHTSDYSAGFDGYAFFRFSRDIIDASHPEWNGLPICYTPPHIM